MKNRKSLLHLAIITALFLPFSLQAANTVGTSAMLRFVSAAAETAGAAVNW